MERAARIASILSGAALLLLVGALCLVEPYGPGLWSHLAAGDLIRKTGTVPRADPFSYTVPGLPWIDVHWLFQVGASALREAAGRDEALTLATAAVVLLLFGHLYARGRRLAGGGAAVAILMVAALACRGQLRPGPEVLSWGLLALFLAALDRALEEESAARRRRLLWLGLPIVQVLWVNLDTLSILGPAALALAVLAGAAALRRRPLQPADADRAADLLVGLAILAVASLATPYGAAALRLPLEKAVGHFPGGLVSLALAGLRPAFVLLAAIAGLAFLANRRRLRLFDILVTGAAFALALLSRRGLPLFAVAAVPVALRNAAQAAGAPRAGLLAHGALAAACLALASGVLSSRSLPPALPEDAARFVADAGIPGQVFHSREDGGYLLFAWKGDRRVFMDGRDDPYTEQVAETYRAALSDPAAFEETVQRYQITVVLWSHARALEAGDLLRHLAHSPAWELIYLDPAAAVYLRRDVPPPPRLPEVPFPADREPGGEYQYLERRLEARPLGGPPVREIALGEFFNLSGDPRGAEFFFRRALQRAPRSAVLLHDLGLALEGQGRGAEARQAQEEALRADPRYLPALGALGRLLVEEGRPDEAAATIEAAMRRGARDPALLAARARLLDRRGLTKEAAAAYQEAQTQAPRDAVLLRAIGSFHAAHGENDEALRVLTQAAMSDPDDPRAAEDAALLLDRLGRPGPALEMARDAAARASRRLETSGSGAGWVAARMEEDRRAILLAARLELRSGHADLARQWLAPLLSHGLLGREDLGDLPEIRALLPGPPR